MMGGVGANNGDALLAPSLMPTLAGEANTARDLGKGRGEREGIEGIGAGSGGGVGASSSNRPRARASALDSCSRLGLGWWG